jgi:hypothetical protein
MLVTLTVLISACGGASDAGSDAPPPPNVVAPPESKWSSIEGFPVSYFSGAGFFPEGAQHSPIVVDIDGLLGLEILVAATTTPSDASISVFSSNGEPLSGWPSDQVDKGTSPFTVANFGEIAVVGGTNTIENNKTVFALNSSGEQLSYFENVPIENYVGQYPVAYDINNDGFDEVFIGDESGGILALDLNGEVLSGWRDKKYRDVCPTGSGQTTKSIAIADLNGDDNREVLLVAGNQTFSQSHCLMALQADGTLLENFPIILPFSPGDDFSIAVGDVDDDEAVEIIYVLKGSAVGDPPELFVFSNTGELELQKVLAGDLAFSGAFPSLADIDNDGKNEIFLLGNGTLNVVKGDGEYAQGFPITFEVENLPSLGSCGVVIGDITGDQDPEIVFCMRGQDDYLVYAYDKNGIQIEDSPLAVSSSAVSIPRGVVIADIDKDGQNEIVVANTDTIWAYKYGDNIRSGEILWGQFGNDAQRSNLATIDK